MKSRGSARRSSAVLVANRVAEVQHRPGTYLTAEQARQAKESLLGLHVDRFGPDEIGAGGVAEGVKPAETRSR
jgi:DNA-binding FadR family transcriptional regulator